MAIHFIASEATSTTPAHRGIRRSHFGIWDHPNRRVNRICVVDERILPDPARIEVPKGNAPAIRTPPKPVAHVQFLFVHPIGCTVDNCVGSVVRQLLPNGKVREILYKQIIRAHEGDLSGIGGHLGELHTGWLAIPAEFRERFRVQIEKPIIASRVLPPHRLAVGEEK